MKQMGVALVAAMALAASPAQAREHGKRGPAAFADPSDIIAAEGSFTRIVAEKGPAAAIHATAAPDAEIFAPRLMRMADYAKNPKVLPPAPQWHTRQLWMSCDGSYGVTHGELQPLPATVAGSPQWFVTIWHRQKGGSYKWVLSQTGPLQAAPPQSDMIAASVADCPVRRAHADATAAAATPPGHGTPAPSDYTSGQADDGTMAWSTNVAADGSRSFSLKLKQDSAMREVLHLTTPPGV